MINEINRLTRNYLHKTGLYQDPRIVDIRQLIEREYNIPSYEIEYINYAQISPFIEYKMVFSDENMASSMKSVFEDSSQYILKSEDDGFTVDKIELQDGEEVPRKIGTILMDSHTVYLDFVNEIEEESPQPSPQTKRILSLLSAYFQEK